MIQTTNNAKDFFERNTEPIYIYGAGNSGYWVSYYMEKCHIDWEGCIDIGARESDCYMYGKKIVHPSELKKCNEKIRIIVAIGQAEDALATLHWYADSNKILCLVPFYKDQVSQKEKTYDINKMLSYFRNRLLMCEYPTFISNTCSAGFAYKVLGLNFSSPTINTGIRPIDFLKFCKNLSEYMEYDMQFSHWTLRQGERIPVGKVKDIDILFPHSDNVENSILYWNRLKEAINWNNIIFIMNDNWFNIPYQIAKEFCDFPNKHMLILKSSMYNNDMKGLIYADKNCQTLHDRSVAIEDWFDFLGWVNGEFEI